MSLLYHPTKARQEHARKDFHSSTYTHDRIKAHPVGCDSTHTFSYVGLYAIRLTRGKLGGNCSLEILGYSFL